MIERRSALDQAFKEGWRLRIAVNAGGYTLDVVDHETAEGR